MKTFLRIFMILIVLVAVLAAPATALAQTPGGEDGKVVFGGSYRLSSGDTLDGSLAVFGGEATLEVDSIVNGDIALSGGTITIAGEVNGDIVILGGSVSLSETAKIHGDITTIGGTINQEDGAQVDGDITNGPNSLSLPLPRDLSRPNLPFNINLDPIGRFIWAIFQSVVMAGLAALVALMAPASTRRVAETIVTQPLVSGGIGLLSAILAPAVLVILAITILLIPVSLLGFLVLAVAIAFGWIALGFEIGNRIAASSRQSWTPPLSAGIGTLLLALIVNLIGLIVCVGWVAPFLVSVLGLGGVIASRAGRQVYAPASSGYPTDSSGGAMVYGGTPRPITPIPPEWQPPAGQTPTTPPTPPTANNDIQNFPPTGGF